MKTTDEEIEDALDRLCKHFGWDTPSEQRGEIRTNMRDLVRWAREERDKEWEEKVKEATRLRQGCLCIRGQECSSEGWNGAMDFVCEALLSPKK